MSYLHIRTTDGRNLDQDLGESGHSGHGHHFEPIGHFPTAYEMRLITERAERRRIRLGPLPNRCATALRSTGVPCGRRAGHNGAHSAKS